MSALLIESLLTIEKLSPFFENPIVILHCPKCRRELVGQDACETARKMLAEADEELTDVFCEHCRLFHKIPDLLEKERYYS